jgi:hypothetical protein
VTAVCPRGPGRTAGGGFAAAHSRRAARRRPEDTPSQGYGAAPPASRLLRIALRAGPDPGDLGCHSGRRYGQAPVCPVRSGGPGQGAGCGPLTRENVAIRVSGKACVRAGGSEAKITRIALRKSPQFQGNPG